VSAAKAIAIIALLLMGFHLLLYGYLKRRIAAAKHKQEAGDDR
jgi:hypothetical protein